MITVLCCYNNGKCLNDMLVPSIKKQTQQSQLIFINNEKKNYGSAAQAYNCEVGNAEGDILVFCHQDIAFDQPDFLENVENIFKEHPNIILGLAGIKSDGMVYSNLKYLGNKEFITQKRVESAIEKVESLDECFIAIKKEHFMKILFNEDLCDNWHLYAVELCYNAKNSELRLNSFVSSIAAYHKMQGGNGLEVDRKYLKTLDKICVYYAKKEKKIYAPCYVVSTKFPRKQVKLFKTKIRLYLNR